MTNKMILKDRDVLIGSATPTLRTVVHTADSKQVLLFRKP